MPLVINTNTSATAASNHLDQNNLSLKKSLSRLSSGRKIVSSADDAGGLAVASKLNSTLLRNVRVRESLNNSLSFLQTQSGSLQVVGKVLSRMTELKTQSLDISKNDPDYENYNKEFKELQRELNQISRQKFNGISLFSDQMHKTLFGNYLDIEILQPTTDESESDKTMNVTRWGIYRNLSQKIEGGDKRPTGFGEKPEALAFSIVNESLMGNTSPFGTDVDGSTRSYHHHDNDTDQQIWDEDNSNWLTFLGSSNIKGKIAVMHSSAAEMAPDRDKHGNYVNGEGVVTDGFTESDIELSSNGNFPYLTMKKDGATVADQVTAFHEMFDSLTNNKTSLPEVLVFNVDNSSSMGFNEVNEAILQFKSDIEIHYASLGKTALIPNNTSSNFASEIGTDGSGIPTGENGYFQGIRIDEGEDYIKQGQAALEDGLAEYESLNGQSFPGTLDNEKSGVKGLLDNIYGLEDFDMTELKEFEDRLSDALAINGSESSRAEYAIEELETKYLKLQAAHGRIMDVDFAQESTKLARYQILNQSSAQMMSSAVKITEIAKTVMGI